MFQKSAGPFQGKPSDPEPKKNFEVKDIEIHSMKNDLKNIEHPDLKIDDKSSQKSPNNEIAAGASPVQREKTSPFLAQENWNKKENLYLKEEKGEEIKKPSLGKAVIIAVIIFVILTAGAGGYYFWITRMDSGQEIPEDAALPEVVLPETLPVFSEDKPNYLSLDIDSLDSAQTRAGIEDYAKKVSESDAVSLIEFVITDGQNNPVTFQAFAQKIGLNLMPDIFSFLGSDFSLFIYSAENRTRLGISIPSTDDSQLLSYLLQNEKNLVRELEPLYLVPSYIIEEKDFGSAVYDEAQVRFLNITSPEDLSVDYSVFKGQLLIGTTKTTLRSIIDYMDKQAGQATDSINESNFDSLDEETMVE